MSAVIARQPDNTGTLFTEILRRSWRSALYWGLGIGMFALLQMVFIQDNATLQQVSEIYQAVPAFLMQGFTGGQDMAYLATPNGYIATQFFSIGLLYFAIFAVVAGLSITANDEDAGILDMVMGLPIRRTQLVIERMAAYTVFAFVIGIIAFGIMILASRLTPAIDYDLGKIGVSTLNMIPSVLLILTFTAAMGALMRRRGTALVAAGMFVVISYFINFIAAGATEGFLAQIAPLSFFHYLNAAETMKNGIQAGNVVILLAAALVFAIITVVAFKRRDIGR